jgi:ferredoxin
MRVKVDETVCIGSGQCEIFCPEVFEVDRVSRVKITRPQPDLESAVREAAEACPSQAISIEEA